MAKAEPLRAPTPRPAKGFGTVRAQSWVMGAALVIAVTYGFRRIVEPSVAAAPARGGKVARVLGAGSPPPALGHWAVAYGAGFVMLSILTLGAPELAASLAMLMVAGSLLANGTTIVADIAGLEGKPVVTVPTPGGTAALHGLGELAPAPVPGAPLSTLKVPGS